MGQLHMFSFERKDWPRTTTKQEYKAVSRWLRLTRNAVEPEVEKRMPYIQQAISDAMILGQGKP